MIEREERCRMYKCADLLPPPGGDELRRLLESHTEASKLLSDLEIENAKYAEALKTIYAHAGSVCDCVDEPGKGYLEDVCDIVATVIPEDDRDEEADNVSTGSDGGES